MFDPKNLHLPQFYLTPEAPCPYLPGKKERKLFTHLIGTRAQNLNNALTHAGFRRSQTIAYRPACESCNACKSVRIVATKFKAGKNFRRILKKNRDLSAQQVTPYANEEHYDLMRRYLSQRHHASGMSDMTMSDYISMVEETTVDTHLMEYRDEDSRLLAVVLTDRMTDGLSLVYSFFDPAQKSRSLGTFIILDQIERSHAAGFTYLYLGYWVDGCDKMMYKARFRPLEFLDGREWRDFTHIETKTALGRSQDMDE